jgi:small ligand-binding sensory domain FIST
MVNSAASRLVLAPFSEQLVTDAARETLREAGGRVSCGFVFASADYQPHLEDFLELVQLHGHVPLVAGCSASGVIGTGVEAEQQTGFSLLFLNLPHTKITAFEFGLDDIESEDGAAGWQRRSGLKPSDVDAWFVLADPFTIAVDRWLHQWNEAYPRVPTMGGLASGGAGAEDVFIFHNHNRVESGAIAIALKGGVRVTPVVSQGCTPIGEPLLITGADNNVMLTLGSKPAYEALSEAFGTLPDSVKERAQGNLFAGLATNEYVDDFKRGDFLIRNIIGANPDTGAVAIGDYPRVGQTMQYQLRDRTAADEDLHQRLDAAHGNGSRPFASLIFCCNGRGKNLFGRANHDAGAMAKTFGSIPATGLFCNGEIGPIGGKNFVHGYTASIALLADA